MITAFLLFSSSSLQNLIVVALHVRPTWLVYDQSRYQTLDRLLALYPPSRVYLSQHLWIYVPGKSGSIDQGDIPALRSDWNLLQAHVKESKHALILLAQKNQVLPGKWIFHVSRNEVDHAWEKIARAVHDGVLGAAAKVTRENFKKSILIFVIMIYVAPYSPSELNHCICVFTSKFLDGTNVKKLRQQLREIGFAKVLEYKPDAFTYVGIYPGNKWNIPESIYRE